MRFFRCLPIVLAVILCGFSAARAADELQAGVAFVDITPPIPFRMHGYFYERLSTGMKDPLHARAIVFQAGQRNGCVCILRRGRHSLRCNCRRRGRRRARRPGFLSNILR